VVALSKILGSYLIVSNDHTIALTKNTLNLEPIPNTKKNEGIQNAIIFLHLFIVIYLYLLSPKI